MRAHLIALALVVPALAACSGGEEPSTDAATLSAQDVDAKWQAAADKELGTEANLASLKDQAAIDCQRAGVSNWIVALGTAGDISGSEITRIGLEHACPDVEETYAEAAQQIKAAADVNALLCAQPAAKLESVERMKLDFIC